MWDDQLFILHATKGVNKEKERWDRGGAVIPDVATATDGYNTIVAELEVGSGCGTMERLPTPSCTC